MLKQITVACLGLVIAALIATSCSQNSADRSDAGWTTLLDGTNLDQWLTTGTANWRIVDGAAQADKGSGHLVSKASFTDFQLRAEFWVDAPANSGIFLRCADPQKIGTATCYEVNIYDQRAEQEYSTGAIVNVAKVAPPTPKAGGRWNTFEITAKGTVMTVMMNGVKTAEGSDGKFPSGRITIQYGTGLVRFRKLQVKPL